MAHFFGNKNRLPNSPELQKIKLNEAIGKTIVCEDNIPRRVVEIVASYRYPWRAIINEQDETANGGHWVNMLSLTSQLIGKGVPDKSAQDSFARSVRMRFGIPDNGITKEHPLEKKKSGIILLK